MGVYYRKDLKKWAVSYVRDGVRVRKVVGTKNEAMREAGEVDASGCQLRLHDYMGLVIQSAAASQPAKTVESYQNSCKQITRGMPDVKLDQLDMEMVRIYQASRLASGVSNGTVNREIAFISKCLTQAQQDRMLARNQLHGIKNLRLPEPQGRVRYLDDHEISALLSQCDGDLYNIVFLAIHSGLRMNEIFSLTWGKVDKQGRVVHVWRKHKRNYSAVPVSAEALKAIQDQPRASTFVFPGIGGGKRTSCRTAFLRAVRAAGIEDCSFHTLRHTFASHAVMSGMDLRTLQDLLGHARLDMVMRYSHLSDTHRHEQLMKLSAKLRVTGHRDESD